MLEVISMKWKGTDSIWKVPLRRLSVLIPNVTNFADARLNPGP